MDEHAAERARDVMAATSTAYQAVHAEWSSRYCAARGGNWGLPTDEQQKQWRILALTEQFSTRRPPWRSALAPPAS